MYLARQPLASYKQQPSVCSRVLPVCRHRHVLSLSTWYSHSRYERELSGQIIWKWALQPNNRSQTPNYLCNNKQIILETVPDL